MLSGSHLPDAEPQSFASLSSAGVIIPDILWRFTVALKGWVESWLAVPICSYFYMPQPAYVQLVHGAMMMTRWIRIAGPDAVKPFMPGTINLQEPVTVDGTWPLTPALSGVPSCPELGLSNSSTTASIQDASAHILRSLRVDIATQINLQINILDIFDTMASRFGAAQKEMTMAQGLEWENNTWDFAAKHLKMKKIRVVKWREAVVMAAGERASLLISASGGDNRGSEEAMDMEDFEWVASNYSGNSLQWENSLFDEILGDIHVGNAFKSIDWNAGPQMSYRE